MAYRNKTFVSFAGEDMSSYNLMKAWRANARIDFNFFDAHDLNVALDTSQPGTVRRRLRERLANTKQVVLLIGDDTRSVASRSSRFLYYELEVIDRLDIPVVCANLNGSRVVQEGRLPKAILGKYTVSVSFQPKIIAHALDNFPESYPSSKGRATGPHHYKPATYKELGL